MSPSDVVSGPRTQECVEGQHHACRGDVWTISNDNAPGCVCGCHDKAVDA